MREPKPSSTPGRPRPSLAPAPGRHRRHASRARAGVLAPRPSRHAYPACRHCPRVPRPRVAYLDLDGTLTRDGSMFHGEKGPTLAGARALLALHEAGVAVVPASGRTVLQLREVARLLGADGFVAELGSVVVRGGRAEVTYDRARWDGPRGPVSNALLARLRARHPVEPHEPWASMREHTLLLRGPPGLAPLLREEAARVVSGVTAIDNGEVEEGRHAYHVLPAEVSKEHAVRRDLEARGLRPEDAVAFGDSEGDRALARAVGTFYHVGGPDGERVVGVRARFCDGLEEAVRRCLSGGATG